MLKVIVTGAGRGIGYDTVLALAARGDCSILALSRNKERLECLQQEVGLRFPDTRVEIAFLDLEKEIPADFPAWAAAVHGGADVLIHNAGMMLRKPFAEMDRGDWLRIFSVNVFGAADLTRVLLPWLEKSGRAHVVHIGSMGGFQGSAKFPGLSAYSASKAAMACLAECLAEEWKGSGIAVNCLAIGAVQTEMLAEAFPGYQAPLDSGEMAAFISDFALNGHRFFNGKVLPVSVSTP